MNLLVCISCGHEQMVNDKILDEVAGTKCAKCRQGTYCLVAEMDDNDLREHEWRKRKEAK